MRRVRPGHKASAQSGQCPDAIFRHRLAELLFLMSKSTSSTGTARCSESEFNSKSPSPLLTMHPPTPACCSGGEDQNTKLLHVYAHTCSYAKYIRTNKAGNRVSGERLSTEKGGHQAWPARVQNQDLYSRHQTHQQGVKQSRCT